MLEQTRANKCVGPRYKRLTRLRPPPQQKSQIPQCRRGAENMQAFIFSNFSITFWIINASAALIFFPLVCPTTFLRTYFGLNHWTLYKTQLCCVTDSHVKFSLAVSSVAEDLRNFLKTELMDFEAWRVKFIRNHRSRKHSSHTRQKQQKQFMKPG